MKRSSFTLVTGACGIAGALLLGVASRAEPAVQPVFAELYTSQGCSSCPAADAFWGTLQGRRDVVALSFSIDYWDYIGWRDTLARHENTLRQQAYGKAMPSRQVYTPQVIVDGVDDVVGNQPGDVNKSINARLAKTRDKRLVVSLVPSGNNVQIRIGAGAASPPATIWVAHTSSSRTVNVARGENAGRVMTYWNVVRDFSPAGTWSGESVTLDVSARSKNANEVTDGLAVWVQEGSSGPVLGAAQIRLAPGK